MNEVVKYFVIFFSYFNVVICPKINFGEVIVLE